ncbi:hypothetical protein GCM10023075_28410 [Streptosporangium album]
MLDVFRDHVHLVLGGAAYAVARSSLANDDEPKSFSWAAPGVEVDGCPDDLQSAAVPVRICGLVGKAGAVRAAALRRAISPAPLARLVGMNRRVIAIVVLIGLIGTSGLAVVAAWGLSG